VVAGRVRVLAVLVLAGCAARVPRVLRPVDAGELLRGLAARRAAVTTLRGRGRLRSGLSGLWTREAIVVRRPDGIRIDVLSPFGLALAVGVHDDLLWAYPPGEATRYEGTATPANLMRFLGAPVAVPDVVDLLLGLPPSRNPVAPPSVAATREGEYRLTVPLAAGEQTIWFGADGLLARRAEETHEGRPVFQAAFDDYRDGFPRVVDVSTGNGQNARLAYDHIELNVAVTPETFAPPPASRVQPLEAVPSDVR
jgi:hypothetical protein